SNEMVIDYRTWFKYVLLIIIGTFSITIMSDLSEGALSYSVLEIVGDIVITAIFIFSVLKGFKHISTMKQSLWKQMAILIPIVMLPVFLFLGLILLNKAVDSPMVHFSNMASMLLCIMTLLLIFASYLCANMWILMMLVVFV